VSSVALPLHHTAHIHSVSKKIGGYFGGGGFSNIFPAPEYQKAAVSAYVKSLGNQYQGLYNKVRPCDTLRCRAALTLLQNGRGYPDVAAQGSRYLIVDGHRYVHVGGTSASSPTFGE